MPPDTEKAAPTTALSTTSAMDDLTPDTQDFTAADRWTPDGQGHALLRDLVIALDPEDAGRWYIARSGSTERLWQGAVLDDDGDGHRESHSLPARLEAEGISAEGLDEWGPWAESEAVRAEMGRAVRNAEAKLADAREAVELVEEAAPLGSFADRVTGRRVSLLTLIEEGIPPVEWIPGAEKIFVKGGRHHLAAPKKSGKSFATLSHAVRMVLTGHPDGSPVRVAVLDRENGAGRYARRLELVMDYMGLTADERARVDANLTYYAFPALRRGDHEEMIAEFREVDLVVLDSQRQFLTNLGYKEDSADDYAEFMVFIIEPLFAKGVATLILDNTGHGDQTRGRGSSAKGDVNDVLLSLKKTLPFDEETQGEVELTIEDSRDGSTGSWKMALGNGVFGTWGRRSTPTPDGPDPALLEAASLAVEAEPGIGKKRLRTALTGRMDKRDRAIDWLAANGHIEVTTADSGGAQQHRPVKPYRVATAST